ncbi:MAG: haloacid dehalogenase [Thermoprotei archaeon]|nr:haloacid dehalogenase [Thermoprotei archaeon]
MEGVVSTLESIIEAVDSYLADRDKVREAAIRLSRDVVRLSKSVVNSIYLGDLDAASRAALDMDSIVLKLRGLLEGYPDIYYSGLVYNALSEYVEASLFLDVVSGRGLRSFEELGVPPVPYLQGLGDLAGELRRLVLDKVRGEDFEGAWRLYRLMEAIYMGLAKLNYVDALIPGVRHRVDVARRLVDETLALLVDLESRRRLQESLRASRALEF